MCIILWILSGIISINAGYYFYGEENITIRSLLQCSFIGSILGCISVGLLLYAMFYHIDYDKVIKYHPSRKK